MRHLPRLTAPGRRGLLASGAVGALALGGCAERAVVAAPGTRPGTGTWVAVWVAGALAAVVLGVLLTLPCWSERSSASSSRAARFVAAVLALQAGVAAVVGILLVGFALRSWQLVERSLEEPPATALVRISRIDGDGALFALIVLTLVLLGGLAVGLLAMGARMAVSEDRLERWVLVAFLGAEVLGAAVLAVLHLIGFGGWPYRSGLVALPILAAAFALAWPRSRPAAV